MLSSSLRFSVLVGLFKVAAWSDGSEIVKSAGWIYSEIPKCVGMCVNGGHVTLQPGSDPCGFLCAREN